MPDEIVDGLEYEAVNGSARRPSGYVFRQEESMACALVVEISQQFDSAKLRAEEQLDVVFGNWLDVTLEVRMLRATMEFATLEIRDSEEIPNPGRQE